MTAPLGQLLSDAWSSFRRALLALAIGAVIFGLIAGIGQSFVGQRVLRETGTLFEGMGFDPQYMEDLQQRMQAGDEAAINELAGRLEQVGGEQGAAVPGAVFTMYKRLMPVIGASALLLWVISLIASAYFLLVALNDKLSFQQAIARTPGLIIPLFLLSLWVIIRSFIWIPIIGIILAIILGPRFVLAPVILARDHKGVLESASMSYAKTSGFWGKIFGNLLVVGILVMVALMVLGIVLSLFGLTVSGIVMPMVNMLGTAFLTIFVVKLSQTILTNAR